VAIVPTETQDPPMTQEERESRADFDPATNPHVRPEGEAAEERPRTLEEIEAAAAEADRASAERAAAAGLAEEEDGQTFLFEQGRKVGLGTVVKRGTPTTYEVKLTGRTLKGPGNLIAFDDPDVTLVALGRAGRVIADPTYADDGSIKSVHVTQEIKTKTFYDARTDAARAALDGE
jgi:hypothetical protein